MGTKMEMKMRLQTESHWGQMQLRMRGGNSIQVITYITYVTYRHYALCGTILRTTSACRCHLDLARNQSVTSLSFLSLSRSPHLSTFASPGT